MSNLRRAWPAGTNKSTTSSSHTSLNLISSMLRVPTLSMSKHSERELVAARRVPRLQRVKCVQELFKRVSLDVSTSIISDSYFAVKRLHMPDILNRILLQAHPILATGHLFELIVQPTFQVHLFLPHTTIEWSGSPSLCMHHHTISTCSVSQTQFLLLYTVFSSLPMHSLNSSFCVGSKIVLYTF